MNHDTFKAALQLAFHGCTAWHLSGSENVKILDSPRDTITGGPAWDYCLSAPLADPRSLYVGQHVIDMFADGPSRCINGTLWRMWFFNLKR